MLSLHAVLLMNSSGASHIPVRLMPSKRRRQNASALDQQTLEYAEGEEDVVSVDAAERLGVGR